MEVPFKTVTRAKYLVLRLGKLSFAPLPDHLCMMPGTQHVAASNISNCGVFHLVKSRIPAFKINIIRGWSGKSRNLTGLSFHHPIKLRHRSPSPSNMAHMMAVIQAKSELHPNLVSQLQNHRSFLKNKEQTNYFRKAVKFWLL